MEKIISHSHEDTKKCAKHMLGLILKAKNKDGATIIGLSGELGAGKTTFVQCLGDMLGIKELMTSPTFVIQKKYELKGQPYERLFHIDAYRLQNGDELLPLGWREISKDNKNLIVIEWAERVADILPSGAHTVSFRHVDENSREIELKL